MFHKNKNPAGRLGKSEISSALKMLIPTNLPCGALNVIVLAILLPTAFIGILQT
jgi:hypothetical protein